MPRKYESKLRTERAAQTRQRILDAALAFLEDHDPSLLSIPKLAGLAGVSVPTAYRYFPDTDALLDALLPVARELLFGSSATSTPRELFPRFERHARLVRTLVRSQAWTQVRRRSSRTAGGDMRAALAEQVPHLSDEELRRYGGLIVALNMPAMWLSGRDQGLSNDDLVEVVEWAQEALLAALRDLDAKKKEEEL